MILDNEDKEEKAEEFQARINVDMEAVKQMELDLEERTKCG